NAALLIDDRDPSHGMVLVSGTNRAALYARREKARTPALLRSGANSNSQIETLAFDVNAPDNPTHYRGSVRLARICAYVEEDRNDSLFREDLYRFDAPGCIQRIKSSRTRRRSREKKC